MNTICKSVDNQNNLSVIKIQKAWKILPLDFSYLDTFWCVELRNVVGLFFLDYLSKILKLYLSFKPNLVCTRPIPSN